MLPRSPVLRRPTCGLDPNIARGALSSQRARAARIEEPAKAASTVYPAAEGGYTAFHGEYRSVPGPKSGAELPRGSHDHMRGHVRVNASPPHKRGSEAAAIPPAEHTCAGAATPHAGPSTHKDAHSRFT